MTTIKLADQDIIRKVTAEHRLPMSKVGVNWKVSVAPRPLRLFVRSLGSVVRRVIFDKGAHNVSIGVGLGPPIGVQRRL
jgi:hypothetical protein